MARDGLAGRVRLLGFVAPRDRAAFFAAVDVLVMPSTYECFGMVAAEALSAGLPVIVTPQTGIAEIVRAHEAGVIVPVGNPDAIRTAIRQILADPVHWPPCGTMRCAPRAACSPSRRTPPRSGRSTTK